MQNLLLGTAALRMIKEIHLALLIKTIIQLTLPIPILDDEKKIHLRRKTI